MEVPPCTRKAYEAPTVVLLGTIAQLTGENFESNNVDYNFGGVEIVGTS